MSYVLFSFVQINCLHGSRYSLILGQVLGSHIIIFVQEVGKTVISNNFYQRKLLVDSLKWHVVNGEQRVKI